uniref:ATP synthase F0 subunit 8 n=1 Tax=Epeorus unispinosus TaxID=2969354 RepID=UPI002176A589|nr:ATP synthase F0 subunit 8 [Epeorus unispinosus]UUJ36774.1 ATP synthase F0 subunit 8 [Epeorus unispinosus]
MPQMAPLSWLLLFLTFSSALIFFSIMNYFLTTHDAPALSSTQHSTPPFNWKW